MYMFMGPMLLKIGKEEKMLALENRPVANQPNAGSLNPFHPETHMGFDNLDVASLPSDEDRTPGTKWMPTGFVIGGDFTFVGSVLKERFFHNPAVGYTFRMEDGMVVEYEHQATTGG